MRISEFPAFLANFGVFRFFSLKKKNPCKYILSCCVPNAFTKEVKSSILLLKNSLEVVLQLMSTVYTRLYCAILLWIIPHEIFFLYTCPYSVYLILFDLLEQNYTPRTWSVSAGDTQTILWPNDTVRCTRYR